MLHKNGALLLIIKKIKKVKYKNGKYGKFVFKTIIKKLSNK